MMCVDLKRHFNWLKVAVMAVLAVMVMMFVLTGTQSAYAGTDNKTYVIDDAGILTSEEEQKLTDMCRKASKNCQLDIVIITMNKNLDYSPMDNYLRSILEEQYGYEETGTDCEAVVYGIDMTSRADRIVTSGRARSSISQSSLDSIRESAEDKLAEGDYYAGCKKYIKGIERKLNVNMLSRLTYYMPVKILISLVAAVIAVLAMMSSARSKMTVNSTEYTKNHGYKMNDRRDVFINTTITKRHIEKSSSSGGSSGGGNSGSSGGHF